MKLKKLIFGVATLGALAVSCDSDDAAGNLSNLNLNVAGLEALGSDFVYEGWLIVDSKPVSTGRFTDPETKTQSVDSEMLEAASAYVLTIEPENETGEALAAPAPTKLFRADFDGNTAAISYKTINPGFADLEMTKSEISGKFFLRTPTDDADGVAKNDEAGVWFGTPGTMPPASSLELPVLAADSGWKYEGWVVKNGVPYSTGTFSDPKAADDNAMTSKFKGTVNDGPPIPGEDFINNLMGTGFEGGADLRGATVVISLEPSPDNDPKPFTLKPMVGTAGQKTAPEAYAFGENLKSFPTGTITR
ncbi:anti-sigma factor [Aquimarina agarilytica]|uniref:anti-sigma factor n=1 Tax=Aquimarina agarilytica TaxID=1087449 RepID=UPI00028A1F36|nr:anti-sigma factor [Aquimarina agarilytica]